MNPLRLLENLLASAEARGDEDAAHYFWCWLVEYRARLNAGPMAVA